MQAMNDRNYCINSFLQFRYVFDETKRFRDDLPIKRYNIEKKYMVKDSNDLDKSIKDYLEKNFDDKTALMLSGGVDSTLLATYLPKGTKVYTLKCIADETTIDETIAAKQTAGFLELDHEVIEITWEDHLKFAPMLMEDKGAPIHSICVQIYKAALKAKEAGYNKLLFGESADDVFGGYDKLLSRDWTVDEFIERYNFVDPNKVLHDPSLITEPYLEFANEANIIDANGFINKYFGIESFNSYEHPCRLAGIKYLSPFSSMLLDGPLDLEKIRSGYSKYIIRDLIKQRMPGWETREKTPMPRPTELWLRDWEGPTNGIFKENIANQLTGDQKWLCFALDNFLNMIDGKQGGK